MWIFTRYGFYSVANARRAGGSRDPEMLMVRARRMSHLRVLRDRFPALAPFPIASQSETDYRYRIVLPKCTWVGVMAELAGEQDWSDFKAEAERFQRPGGADYIQALHDVWGVMHRLQQNEPRFSLINRDADGAITNPADLTAEDVVSERVLCPACGQKAFAAWPEGWDGHAAHACTIEGDTAEEKKANYKRQFRHLFR